MQIKIPATDLKAVQSVDSIELKDEAGRPIGQYLFGKGHGRTIFLFGKYKRAHSSPTLSARRSLTVSLP